MAKSVEQLEKENEELLKELDNYKTAPEKRAYFSLVRIVNQQVDYLNSFNIKSNIVGKASEDATFVRTQAIWEKLPLMITSLNDLKISLKINQQDEDSETRKYRITTPETISDVLGNSAGQHS